MMYSHFNSYKFILQTSLRLHDIIAKLGERLRCVCVCGWGTLKIGCGIYGGCVLHVVSSSDACVLATTKHTGLGYMIAYHMIRSANEILVLAYWHSFAIRTIISIQHPASDKMWLINNIFLFRFGISICESPCVMPIGCRCMTEGIQFKAIVEVRTRY